MKHLVAIVALAGISAAFCQSVSAQGNAGTYFGWNGPSSGPVAGETFVATVYGDAIEIVPRADQCGRPFFIQGVMSIQPNLNTGTIGGVMTRCTNPELFDCDHSINYEVGFQGTVRRDETQHRLFLQLTYTMEIWNKDKCRKEREERRSESLELLYQPPTPPESTLGDTVHDIYVIARQRVYDGIWTLGGLSPR